MKLSNLRILLRELISLLQFMDPRSRRAYYVGISVSGLFYTLFTLSFSFVIQGLIQFAETGDQAYAMESFYILGGAVALLILVTPWFSFMFQRSIENTLLELRKKLFTKFCRLKTGYLEQNHHGDLLSRTNNDVAALELTYGGLYFSLLLELLLGFGSIISMFFVQWQFAAVSLLSVGFSFSLSTRYVQKLRVLYDLTLELQGKMTGKFSDFIAGIQVVKLFRGGSIFAKYSELNEEEAQVARHISHKNGMLNGVNHLVSFLSFSGIIIVGSLFYAYGHIGMGTVAALAVLQLNVTNSFMGVGTLLSGVQNSLAGAQRIRDILEEQEEPDRLPSQGSELRSAAAVEFRNVEFAYPGHSNSSVLMNLSLQVAPGQVAAIVGGSGSGKSTLIKLLLGFYPAGQGEILLQGKPLGQYSLDGIRSQIAYVPQEPFLFSGTIEENIRHGCPDASEEAVREAAAAAHADSFIRELPGGYQTEVGERGASLSGGQRQRIAIARAILKNAPVLLLDEATSALDAESEYWVQQALNRLMQGRTTLLIAHRLTTVEKADVIFVMKEGRVIEQGTHQVLLNNRSFYSGLQQGQH